MININLFKINEVCIKNPIGLEQMGYIYPRIMKYITLDNQDELLTKIGAFANEGLNEFQIIERIIAILEK